MDKYCCEVRFRKDKNGKIVYRGAPLVTDYIIVTANSENLAKQVAWNTYSREKGVSVHMISIGKIVKMN